MIAYLSTRVYDLDGHVVINMLPRASDAEYSRRVSRSPTLDGSVAVYDGGYSDGDRTITLQWKPVSEDIESNIKRIIKLYGLLTYSDSTGVYRVAPAQLTPGNDQSSLTLLIIEKESE